MEAEKQTQAPIKEDRTSVLTMASIEMPHKTTTKQTCKDRGSTFEHKFRDYNCDIF